MSSNNFVSIFRKLNPKQFGLAALVLGVFAIALLSLASYISQPKNASTFLTADITAPVYMAYNLIYEHGSFFEWSVGTAPYFFPDIAVIALISLLTKNAFHILLTYAFLQITTITILIVALFKVASQSTIGLRFGILVAFGLLIRLLVDHDYDVYGHDAYLSNILYPCFHYGSFILVFTLLFLFLKMLSNSAYYLKAIFIILLILTGFSDPLIFLYFTFPMCVTLSIVYFLKQISKKEYLIYLSLLMGSFVIAFIVSYFLPIEYQQVQYHPSLSILFLFFYIKTLFYFLQKDMILGIVWILFMCSAPFSLWQSFKKRPSSIDYVDFVILFQWLTVIISTPVILLTVYQMYPSFIQTASLKSYGTNFFELYKNLRYLPYRYFLSYFLGPVFIGYPFLLYKHFKDGLIKKISSSGIYIGILALLALTIFILKAPVFHKDLLVNFDSPLAVCLNHYAKPYHLKNGIADDFQATNEVNAYSHSVHVALVEPGTLKNIHWLNTWQLYQYPYYNFAVVMKDATKKTLITRYGKPTKILLCQNTYRIKQNLNSFIYVYQNGKLKDLFG